jgi:methyl-accepting chemotaxis protein
MSAKNRSLKNLLINPAFQLKYVFWISTAGIILIACNALIFYSYIKENYSILVDLSPMDEAAKTQLYHELNVILYKLGGVSLVFMLLAGILGIKISHSTAGPLYHFKRVFNEIKNGKTESRIRLRPGDDFKDVAQAFNDMMDSVQKKN